MEGEIRIECGTPAPLIFADERQLIEFLAAQAGAWRDLQREYSMHDSAESSLSRFLSDQNVAWFSVNLSAHGVLKVPSSFSERLQQGLMNRTLILIEDPMVARARLLLNNDRGLAEFFLHLVSGELQNKLKERLGDPGVLSWYAKGLAHLATTDAALDQLRLVENFSVKAKEKFHKVTDDGVKVLADTQQRKTQVIQDLDELIARASEARDSIDAEWARMRETYDNALKLSAPRTYWDAKKKEHERIARNWRKGFFVASSTGLLVLATLSSLMIRFWGQVAEPLGAHAWIVPVLMTGIPAFMVLWLLRLCGRLWGEHMTREEDARERIVMIETFLALSRSEDSPNTLADSAQLTLVLGAIFRAGPGLGSDDSPPAGLLEALVAKLGVSKGN
ncbi:MAG: hypothetical protein E6Q50_06235 [Lysobacter sp.]|nr:MAG: hypothetical protein E6Q50_06235 [Lysobacter sp.]